MNNKIIILAFLLFVCGLVQAQKPANTKDSFLLLKTYEGDIANALIDNLDNLYIISSTGGIKKFNSAGDSMGVYNQVRNFGKLTSLDVSNPLKLLLFYKDFSTVVILDRFLASLATIDLRRFRIIQPAAIGLSYDNNIWVFDEYDNKLKKLDEQGNKLLETPDFRTLFNENFAPQKIISDNGLVYLADTLRGVFIFDNYGAYKKKLPVTNWQSISVKNENIISTSVNSVTILNTSTLQQTQKRIPFFTPYVHSFSNATRFASFTGNNLRIYQYRF